MSEQQTEEPIVQRYRTEFLVGIVPQHDGPVVRYEDYESLSNVLHEVVNAWESLPGGRFYLKTAVQNWLVRDMAQAIQKARDVLGRERPNG